LYPGDRPVEHHADEHVVHPLRDPKDSVPSNLVKVSVSIVDGVAPQGGV
jgi:hypothetical protein